MFILGGFTESNSNTIDRYDLTSNIWDSYDIMLNNKSKFGSSLLYNGNILMIGGK